MKIFLYDIYDPLILFSTKLNLKKNKKNLRKKIHTMNITIFPRAYLKYYTLEIFCNGMGQKK